MVSETELIEALGFYLEPIARGNDVSSTSIPYALDRIATALESIDRSLKEKKEGC